jgi:hypothetical protein
MVAEVRFDHGALASLDELRDAGSRVLDASRRYQTVTVAVPPARLRGLTGLDGVEAAAPVPTPFTYGTCGSVNSEGDTHLAAAEARADFGVDGTGVTVGILSDSFDRDPTAPTRAADDVDSGDLPGTGNPCGFSSPVSVFDDTLASEPSDEGRGMAQIVHDLAPGATIAFATAFKGEIAFANSIRSLAAAGASVIVDDVGYFEEPFFQDGPVGVAIDEVTEEGVAYFSAAGNDNLISGGLDFASWETPKFRETAACPPLLKLATLFTDHCLDFDPAPGGEDNTYGITVEKEDTLTLDLQWAEPWNGVKADIDVYLLDDTGKPLLEGTDLVGSTENNVGAKGTQKPVELFSWDNEAKEPVEVQLAINRCFGLECNEDADPAATPRVKLILLQNGRGVSGTEYPVSSGPDVVGPTIFGHAGAPSAIAVGAVQAGVTTQPERYSSRGPVTHYFGPVSGSTPAAPLVEPVPKPDIAATDCGRTTFFATLTASGFRFCGTSAAAPHAAAVGALARQANPGLTPAQIGDGMAATARPVGSFGPNAVGGGLVDAHRLLEDFALPPAVTIVNPPKPISNNRSPSIGFSANRPVSFSCSLDGGELLPCSSPFTPIDPLRDGVHGFAVRGEDLAGKVGNSRTVSFVVDTVAPRTSFSRRPRHTLRTRRRTVKAVFGFRSSEPGSTFTCRIDGGLVRFCPPRLRRRFKAGRHVMRAMAVDAAGNVDKTPATFRFNVRRVGRRSR